MTRVVLDVDCGLGVHGADIDDGLEILLALGSNQVALEAITVVAGNVDLDLALSSVSALLGSMGATSIPVGKGLNKPLCRHLVTGQELIRRRIQERGCEYPAGPGWIASIPPHRSLDTVDAVDLLIDIVLTSLGEITLVATAPLTNIAVAIQREIRFAPGLKEIILMGGVYQIAGNVTPYTEFNIATDPEAARIVFQSGARITMVPFDVTSRTLLTMDDWRRIAKDNRWLSRFVIEATADWLRFLRRGLGLPGCQLHDLLALAITLDPSIVTTRPAVVTISTEDPMSAGQTIIDFQPPPPVRPTADVVIEHDNKRFMELVEVALHG